MRKRYTREDEVLRNTIEEKKKHERRGEDVLGKTYFFKAAFLCVSKNQFANHGSSIFVLKKHFFSGY